jgi:hypothetical protein
MTKAAANRGPCKPDFLPDALLSELRERADERRSELIECLGQGVRSDPGCALVDVILAAARYHQFVQLYRDAPTRSFLRSRLTKLRDAVRTAGKILDSGDSFLLAALSLGGLTKDEPRALDLGFGSKVQAVFRELEGAADEALALTGLTGPASGQKSWAEGPKTALAIRCARIFEKYRPGEVTRTESKSGGFPAFVRIVYKVATGEMDATLDRAIRDAIAAIRDDRDIKPSSNPFRDAFDPLEELRRHLRKL